MSVIDKNDPISNKQMKENTQRQLDSKVLEKWNARGKFFKKFIKSRLNIDKELYKKSNYNASKFITTKKVIILQRDVFGNNQQT